jgi:hypothetical protein
MTKFEMTVTNYASLEEEFEHILADETDHMYVINLQLMRHAALLFTSDSA